MVSSDPRLAHISSDVGELPNSPFFLQSFPATSKIQKMYFEGATVCDRSRFAIISELCSRHVVKPLIEKAVQETLRIERLITTA
jgi:hypothetical protein